MFIEITLPFWLWFLLCIVEGFIAFTISNRMHDSQRRNDFLRWAELTPKELHDTILKGAKDYACQVQKHIDMVNTVDYLRKLKHPDGTPRFSQQDIDAYLAEMKKLGNSPTSEPSSVPSQPQANNSHD